MHRHCVFEDRGPNCSAHRLKRRPIVMRTTLMWRPQTYASARGCVTHKPRVTPLSVLLVARNSLGLICHGRSRPCSSGSVFSTLALQLKVKWPTIAIII